MYMLKGCIPLICLVIFLGGCATHLPGSPDHNWLNGKWFAQRGSGWTTELDLKVVDGNKIVGTNTQTSPEGKQGLGDINGEVEGDKVSFKVYFPHSGNTYTYTLLRNGDKLEGRSSTGSASLKKVS